MASDPAPTYRPARPGEHEAADALDNSFTTTTVLRVTADEDGFRLHETPVSPPLRKVFPDEPDEPAGPAGPEGAELVVAELDGEVRGAVTTVYESWNRRLVIADLRVAPGHRGRGIGRGLMDRALARGRAVGARTAWLEVSNVNAPAVRAYRRMGFTVCGLDTTLYTGTPAEGELALFMARPLGPAAGAPPVTPVTGSGPVAGRPPR
ncbi:GNAT family N-acetyltransferase [Streptomyces sp. NPDC049577]|uniref:GNAT family N-acetyltransferase n=1 Tax=Streptomyces sp. NPDC049577 TaxID=3155153 RepID=UPI003413F428